MAFARAEEERLHKFGTSEHAAARSAKIAAARRAGATHVSTAFLVVDEAKDKIVAQKHYSTAHGTVGGGNATTAGLAEDASCSPAVARTTHFRDLFASPGYASRLREQLAATRIGTNASLPQPSTKAEWQDVAWKALGKCCAT